MHNTSPPWYMWLLPWRHSSRRAATIKSREAVARLEPAVVITGGSRGIGLALAQRFIEAGHKTAIVARNAAELEEASAALKVKTGTNVVAIVCDVRQATALDVISSELTRSGLYLDVLVNNAAFGLAGSFVDQSDAELSDLIALNVEALTRLTRSALPDMLARGQGGVLNVASLGGTIPGPNQAAYYASKAYVVSLTEAIASEIAGQGVRMSALLPGPVNTSFHEEIGAERSLYRYVLPPMSPEAVARSAYRGFMLGNRVIVPGISNMFFYIALRLLPHVVTVPMMYWLLRRSDRLSGR